MGKRFGVLVPIVRAVGGENCPQRRSVCPVCARCTTFVPSCLILALVLPSPPGGPQAKQNQPHTLREHTK